MRWRFAFSLIAVWLLASASSCQLGVRGPTTNLELSGVAAGLGIGLVLVSGTIVCLSDTERCFLDEEAVRAKAEVGRQIQARFTSGLRRTQAGDAAGLEDICVAAYLGSPQAQYFYGVTLLRRDQGGEEARLWLARAAAHGHRAADILLRQLGGGAAAPDAVAPNGGGDAAAPEIEPDSSSDADEAPTPEEAVAAAAAAASAICARDRRRAVAAADGLS